MGTASVGVSYADSLPLTRQTSQEPDPGYTKRTNLTKLTGASTLRHFLTEIFNISTFALKFSTFPLGGKLDAAGHVREAGEMKLVRDLHGARRTTAVLAEDDLGRAGVWVVLLEGVRPVQKHDDVGVLL